MNSRFTTYSTTYLLKTRSTYFSNKNIQKIQAQPHHAPEISNTNLARLPKRSGSSTTSPYIPTNAPTVCLFRFSDHSSSDVVISPTKNLEPGPVGSAFTSTGKPRPICQRKPCLQNVHYDNLCPLRAAQPTSTSNFLKARRIAP